MSQQSNPGDELRDEVGVRELNSRLSQYVRRAAEGRETFVTLHGKRVAKLVAVTEADPLDDLRRRGLITEPSDPDSSLPGKEEMIKPQGSVSDLIIEQRR